ncbi:MAG: hypothetical protein FWE05_09610 [Defluviitaleaceae bacterium]|nr:hypothetical protein [Defluviitaleaceae bacterium]
MSAIELQKKIDSFRFWDARVDFLNCNYFADEIELSFSIDDLKVIYRFIGCYKSLFDHVKGYDKLKPVREMTIPQLPYFLQDIEINEVIEDNIIFYTCKINMFPLNLEIWCKDIETYSSNNL